MLPAIERDLRIERIVLVGRALPFMAAINGANALIAIAVLYAERPDNRLFGWLAIFLLLTALLLIGWWRNRHRGRPSRPSRRFDRSTVFWAGAVGGMWGALVAVQFPVAGPDGQLILGMICAGMAGGAVVALSPVPTAASFFVAACAMPLAAICALTGGFANYALVVLTLIYASFLIFWVRYSYSSLQRSIELRHHNEELLEKANEANRSKTAFLAQFSHELRTPLNAILGFSESISRQIHGPLDNDTYRQYAGLIHDSGRHLLDLINDILDASRIEASAGLTREAHFDLAAIVRNTVHMVHHAASEKNLSLIVTAEEALPVRGDERALRQITLNLLSNAIKFTARGGRVEVGTRICDGGAPCLVVSDTGIGIPAERIQDALSPFKTLRDLSPAAGENDDDGAARAGAGLGLPIARTLAQLHDGDLVIDSTPGQGTTVTVTLAPERLIADTESSGEGTEGDGQRPKEASEPELQPVPA